MDSHKQAIFNELSGYNKETGLSISDLAKKSELSPTTFTRFMNKPEISSVIKEVSMIKVRHFMEKWRNENNRQAALDKFYNVPAAEIIGGAVFNPQSPCLLEDEAERGLIQAWRQIDESHKSIMARLILSVCFDQTARISNY
jgi:hypothetical protein